MVYLRADINALCTAGAAPSLCTTLIPCPPPAGKRTVPRRCSRKAELRPSAHYDARFGAVQIMIRRFNGTTCEARARAPSTKGAARAYQDPHRET